MVMLRRTPPEENIPLIGYKPFVWRGAPGPKGPTGGGAGTGPALAPWLQDIQKIMSHPEDKAFLDSLVARGVKVTAFDRIYFDDPYYDGTRWTTRHFEAGGTTSGTQINMIRSTDAAANAATIYHEGVHTGQSSSMAWRDKEYDAYVKEDGWRIAHGLPPHDPSFRTTDASGREITNEAAVRAMVDREYPGVTAKSASGAIEQITGRTSSGDTVVTRANGSTYTRPPKAGDSFPGAEVTVPAGGMPVDLSKLK
jgi:hypothetical protein